ncbi:MAG: leukotoxin LktA family filamentous adhesin, partial [Zoogloeaceae bacterium]|nr:leukotoxin LktA family filamentous adhesin [Zoogloeaceae bacterium]
MISLLKRMALGLAGLPFAATAADITNITSANSAVTTVTQNDGVFKIESNKIVDGNALNAFKTFTLGENRIANIYVPSGATTGNVLNFVGSRIDVDGTINGIRDNKIGGNLYFLSADGMIVGSKGAINAGSFFAITPTQSFMDKFLGDGRDAQPLVNGSDLSKEIGWITNIDEDGVVKPLIDNGKNKGIPVNSDCVDGEGYRCVIPINTDGSLSITIRGEVRAIDNIGLYAGKGGVAAESGSLLKTGVVDFSDVVNVDGMGFNDLAISGLEMSSGKDGNIVLSATVVDKLELLEYQWSEILLDKALGYTAPIKVLPVALGTGILIDEDGKVTLGDYSARVTANGKISAVRNISITAKSVVDGYAWLTTDMAAASIDAVVMALFANGDAEVNVGGHLYAGGNLAVEANSDIKVNAKAAVTEKPEVTVDYADGALMVALINNDALVNIDKGARLEAKDDVSVNAAAKSNVSTAAEVNASDKAYVSAAVNWTAFDSAARVNLADGALEGENVNVEASNTVDQLKSTVKAKVGIKSQETGSGSGSGSGSGAGTQVAGDVAAAIIAGGSAKDEKVGDRLKEENSGQEINNSFALAGGLLVAYGDHVSEVDVDTKNFSVEAEEDLTIKAVMSVDNYFLKSTSEGANKQKESEKLSVALALLYGDISAASSVNLKDADAVPAASGAAPLPHFSASDIDISAETVIKYNRAASLVNALTGSIDSLFAAIDSVLPGVLDSATELGDMDKAIREEIGLGECNLSASYACFKDTQMELKKTLAGLGEQGMLDLSNFEEAISAEVWEAILSYVTNSLLFLTSLQAGNITLEGVAAGAEVLENGELNPINPLVLEKRRKDIESKLQDILDYNTNLPDLIHQRSNILSKLSELRTRFDRISDLPELRENAARFVDERDRLLSVKSGLEKQKMEYRKSMKRLGEAQIEEDDLKGIIKRIECMKEQNENPDVSQEIEDVGEDVELKIEEVKKEI